MQQQAVAWLRPRYTVVFRLFTKGVGEKFQLSPGLCLCLSESCLEDARGETGAWMTMRCENPEKAGILQVQDGESGETPVLGYAPHPTMLGPEKKATREREGFFMR